MIAVWTLIAGFGGFCLGILAMSMLNVARDDTQISITFEEPQILGERSGPTKVRPLDEVRSRPGHSAHRSPVQR
jgi:hypothetical protein